MKVAVISSQAFSLLNFRGPLLKEMCQRGHEVHAFAPDFNMETKAALKKLGVHPVDFTISRSGVNPLKEISVVWELRGLLRAYQPDVCFTYFLKPVIYGTIAAWLARVPRRYGLIAGLGYAFSKDKVRSVHRRFVKSIVSILIRFISSRSSMLIFQNGDDYSEAVSIGMVAPNKAIVVGATGVDLVEWPIMPLPRDCTVFILVARLLRDKGIGEYVEAARILRARYPSTRFLLLGGLDDNPAAISRREIDVWVSEGLIEWPGHVSVRSWLAKANVFVLPSYYREGVPRSTQEAMALGRPVITTDAPGCRETVIEGRNGFLVPPRNPQALAKAMLHFIEKPGDIGLMGVESRKIAEERFDVNRQNRKTLAIMGL